MCVDFVFDQVFERHQELHSFFQWIFYLDQFVRNQLLFGPSDFLVIILLLLLLVLELLLLLCVLLLSLIHI